MPAVELGRDELQERYAPITMKRRAQDAVRGFVSERTEATARSPRVRFRRVHFGHEVDTVFAHKCLK